jgi:hypothetical protein
MVRSLVENHVAKRNTIIVIAMPMSGTSLVLQLNQWISIEGCLKFLILDDIEMMQAVVIAGKSDPDKGRTIGV